MTIGQLKARKTWILGNKKMNRNPNMNHGAWLHQRGYHFGDIRCTKCKKWINPKNPFEAIEIKYSPKGKRTHDLRYCTVVGKGVAAFITVARHAPSRRRRLDNVKRY